ncbi:MAG: hypothetical protein ACRDYA_07695 [Egibacteraceae bacterium]
MKARLLEVPVVPAPSTEIAAQLNLEEDKQGVGLVYVVPRGFWGEAVQGHFFPFALFVGMNLANSANPVLARILMDLGLLKGGIGTLSMTATSTTSSTGRCSRSS